MQKKRVKKLVKQAQKSSNEVRKNEQAFYRNTEVYEKFLSKAAKKYIDSDPHLQELYPHGDIPKDDPYRYDDWDDMGPDSSFGMFLQSNHPMAVKTRESYKAEEKDWNNMEKEIREYVDDYSGKYLSDAEKDILSNHLRYIFYRDI